MEKFQGRRKKAHYDFLSSFIVENFFKDMLLSVLGDSVQRLCDVHVHLLLCPIMQVKFLGT